MGYNGSTMTVKKLLFRKINYGGGGDFNGMSDLIFDPWLGSGAIMSNCGWRASKIINKLSE